ncbi:MAG: suppressor of fused domain protein [Succinivibrionaceae bacterium]|nr:suppressor of fused domain protein [Succinivibrionaceae bacterium]
MEGNDELAVRVRALYESDRHLEIVGLLEPLVRGEEGLSYPMLLELSRAYINAAAAGGDGRDLLSLALEALDRGAATGKDDPRWQFLYGTALFRQGLTEDARMRLERVQRLSRPGRDDDLFSGAAAMLRRCGPMGPDPLAAALRDKVLAHYGAHLGTPQVIGEAAPGVDLALLPGKAPLGPVLATVGLSRHVMPVPEPFAASENARLEILAALPRGAGADPAKVRGTWLFRFLGAMAGHVASADAFVGFGYAAEAGQGGSRFSGGMLCGVGFLPQGAQAVDLGGGALVRLFELVPLTPLELSYRERHTAKDLLDLFRLRKVSPSPCDEGRSDVCAQVRAKGI